MPKRNACHTYRKEFVLGWLITMNEKAPFGTITATDFEIGDIVEWLKWDANIEDWISNYGILISIENKVISDRLVSVSTIKPLNDKDKKIVKLFTISLKHVDIKKKND